MIARPKAVSRSSARKRGFLDEAYEEYCRLREDRSDDAGQRVLRTLSDLSPVAAHG